MNAYFQLMMSPGGTAVRLVPPSDGGEKINIAELTEYLQLKNVEVPDLKALYQAAALLDREKVVPLTSKCGFPEQEMFSLRISEDGMEAVARFYPPSNNGSPISGKEEIIQDLKFRNVAFGYDEAAIEAYLAKRNYCEDIVVARGMEPVQGRDARIEYYFNTDLSTRPTRNEDGSVDFFHLNTINHCKAGDVLAKLYKEVPGKPGSTVRGEKISPRDIKHLSLKYGRNITLSEDGCTLISDLNGHVSLTGDKVFVSDVYEVENVGTATGNIESEGSVLVTGNVQAGFSIKAKGNVEVRGVVEGAHIETDGDIIIARGMNGMGKGVLKAGGRVILKFAENATIYAGAYVESESILHSNVNANTEVIVDGRRGFIAGGIVRATEKISCKTLGSSMGADTVVEVGVTPEQKKRFQELQKEVQLLSRFTTYLKFDILENGNSLRATIGSSSGGETQTPFYVAVLVSLFSVYDAGNDGLQLAIFDEAFDKMDNERIEECIYLLKSLGFQAIIVTPTDKISNLSKVADATLIATTDEKNGQRVSTVQRWSQKENIAIPDSEMKQEEV